MNDEDQEAIGPPNAAGVAVEDESDTVGGLEGAQEEDEVEEEDIEDNDEFEDTYDDQFHDEEDEDDEGEVVEDEDEEGEVVEDEENEEDAVEDEDDEEEAVEDEDDEEEVVEDEDEEEDALEDEDEEEEAVEDEDDSYDGYQLEDFLSEAYDSETDENWSSDEYTSSEDSSSDEETVSDHDVVPSPLSWRMDPDESRSDWIIEVERHLPGEEEVSGEVDTYHVHKLLLSVGSQRSERFVAEFRHEGTNLKAQEGVTRLKLHHLAADAFPVLLDYVYSRDGSCNFTTENATALAHLADYLDIVSLRTKAKTFWRQDVSLDNVHIYYAHASVFPMDDIIFEGVVEVLVDNLYLVSTSAPILDVATPQLLMEVLTSEEFLEGPFPLRDGLQTSSIDSHRLSKLVLAFCKIHDNDLTPDDFRMFTTEEILPTIHFEAALGLLQLEQTLLGIQDWSSLKERCFESIRKNINGLHPDSELMVYLRSQNSDIVIRFFTGCVNDAETRRKEEIADLKETQKSEVERLNREHKAQMEEGERAHKAIVRKMEREHEMRIEEGRRQVMEQLKGVHYKNMSTLKHAYAKDSGARATSSSSHLRESDEDV